MRADRTARSLVTDVVGLYVRPVGGWIAVADLLRLLADLGVEPAATRTAVSRMVRDGILARHVRNGVSGYGLTDAVLPRMERADRRILSYHRAEVGEPWIVASYSVPEAERRLRDRLRRFLTAEGFGTPSRGVWMLPEHHLDDVISGLADEGFDHAVDLLVGSPVGDERSMVARSWDLPRLARGSQRLEATVETMLSAWPASRVDDPAAYVDYTSLVDAWRPLAFHDPGLPLPYLSGESSPIEASFDRLRRRLEPAAHRHVAAVAGDAFVAGPS